MSVTASRPTCEKGGVAQGDGMAWPRVRLGDVMQRYNEIVHPGDRDVGEAVFVGLEHIEPGTGRRIGSGTVGFARMTGRKPTFRRGQIVYGYLRPYLNKVWIAEFDGCSSVDQFAFEVNRELASVDFIASFLRSEVFLERSAIVTTTGQLPRISIEEIEAVELELPPLAVQERIAGRLADQLAAVERGRAAARERLAAAEALPAAYVRETFSELDGSTPNGCPRVRVGDVCQLVNGNAYKESDWSPSGARIIRIQNLNDHSKPFNHWAGPVTDLVQVKDGEVLLAWSGTPGTSFGAHLWERGDAVLNQHIFRVDLDRERCESHWFVHAVNHALDELINAASGAVGLRHVTKGEVQALLIPLPPRVEQQHRVSKLSRRLSEADKLVVCLRDELALIAALPAALLRRAFGAEHEA